MTFINQNECSSFSLSATTTLTQLSSFICSEVLILNKSGTDLDIYDSLPIDTSRAFRIGNSESVVLRGVTNSDQLSVQTTTDDGGLVYFRTAFFSNLNQR